MVWISNIIFYNLFRFEKKTQSFFNNIVFLFLKNKKIKELYNKRGIENPEKIINHALEDPEIGISSIISSAHLVSLYFLLILGCINFVLGFFKIEFHLSLVYFVIIGLVSYGFAYWFSFRKNRFLTYFKNFERLSKAKKARFAWLTLFIVLLIWGIGISSVAFRIYRIKHG